MYGRRRRLLGLLFVALVIFDALPLDADRLRRRRMSRRFPTNWWCPDEPVRFVADGPWIRIRFDLDNTGTPLAGRLDNVFVVREDVYEANLRPFDVPVVDELTQCPYTDDLFEPPADRQGVVFEERFDGPGAPPGWTHVSVASDVDGTGASTDVFFISPAQGSSPEPETGVVDPASSALGLGRRGGSPTAVTEVAVSGLSAGTSYVLSTWWYMVDELVDQDRVAIDIWGGRFGGERLAPSGEQSRIEGFSAEDVDVVTGPGTDFVVSGDMHSFYERDGYRSDYYGVQGALVDTSGSPLGQELAVGFSNTVAADAAMAPSGEFIVVWDEGSAFGDIDGQRFDFSGMRIGAPIGLVTSGSGNQRPEVAIQTSGRFLVVWEENSGLRRQLFEADGTPLGGDLVFGSGSRPTVVSDGDDEFVVTWEDGTGNVAALHLDSGGVPLSSEIQVNAWSTGTQSEPAIDVDPTGGMVVVWESDGSPATDASGLSIQGQRFHSNGTADGDQFQVNTWTTDDQENPAVAVGDDGAFFVVWSNRDSEILGQQFSSDGTFSGDEFQVNRLQLSSQDNPAVGAEENGEFVVVWRSYDVSVGGINGYYSFSNGIWPVYKQQVAPELSNEAPSFSDFEPGADGWVADGLWHRTTACAAGNAGHSATTAFYFGLDASCTYGTGGYYYYYGESGHLESPSVDLSGLATPLYLTFKYFLDTRDAVAGRDSVQVRISSDGGTSYQTVADNDPAQSVVTLADPSVGWRDAAIDLSAFLGQEVLVRFSVVTDGQGDDLEGFLVDDVRLFQALRLCPDTDGLPDANGDGWPDECDICPDGDDLTDSDGDGVPDACDECRGGNDHLDANEDGVVDECETTILTVTVLGSLAGAAKVTSIPAGIDCNDTCSADFPGGTAVELVATVPPDRVFGGWSGACTGTGTCTVTMDGDHSVTATFLLEFSVVRHGSDGTVTSSPAGIDCGATCVAGFETDQVITLEATAPPGSAFVGWSWPCGGTGTCDVEAWRQTMNATFGIEVLEIALSSGVPVAGSLGAAADAESRWHYYSVDLSSEVDVLSVQVTGLTEPATIYVHHRDRPVFGTPATCAITTDDLTCDVVLPSAGRWWIGLTNANPQATANPYEVTATWDDPSIFVDGFESGNASAWTATTRTPDQGK